MRYTIIDGLPYIVISGNAYAVDLSKNSVRIDKSAVIQSGVRGRYTITEILAKCGAVSSIKRTRRKKES